MEWCNQPSKYILGIRNNNKYCIVGSFHLSTSLRSLASNDLCVHASRLKDLSLIQSFPLKFNILKSSCLRSISFCLSFAALTNVGCKFVRNIPDVWKNNLTGSSNNDKRTFRIPDLISSWDGEAVKHLPYLLWSLSK